MRIRRPKTSIVAAAELPSVVTLESNLFAASFPLMKLLPARFIMDRARDDGTLKPGAVVIETSSGTFGLGLAMVCNQRGHKCILVSDPAIDPPLRRRLEELGATVEIVREPAAVGGYQRARLDRLDALRAAHPGHFWPSQYGNPHNAGAYAAVVELLLESVGEIHTLVGTVGSGGSVCGMAGFLRDVLGDVEVAGVDTFGSVLFGHPDAGKRLLRGLGNSLMPPNVEHAAFDHVHWVSAAAGFAGTRALHREHALYMGPTSGTAFLVARWYAARHPDRRVVVILPDEGFRYQDTVYDDVWLKAQGALMTTPPAEPTWVTAPTDAQPEWAALEWKRRTYEQVMGRVYGEG